MTMELLMILVILSVNLQSVFCTLCEDADSCKHSIITDYAQCYGYRSCMDATIDSKSFITCTGYESCYAARVIKSPLDIYCSGEFSCSFAATSIHSEEDVYCSGHYGCSDTQIQAVNIICDGNYGCTNTDILCISDVHCKGHLGCLSSTINAGKNINCGGDQACYLSVLSAGQDVHCYGNFGCRESKIMAYDISTVFVYGRYGASKATIYAENVYVGGYRSLVFGTVDSNNNLKLSVTVDGRYAGYGALIICRGGAICTLNCGQTGCFNLNYVCLLDSKCSINPSQCGDPAIVHYGNGKVHGTSCPEWKMSDSLEDDNDLIAFINGNNENDKVYIEEQTEFDSQQQQNINGDKKDDRKLDLTASNSGDVQSENIKNNLNGSLIGIFITLLVMTNFINCMYFKCKYKDSAYKQISNPSVIHFK